MNTKSDMKTALGIMLTIISLPMMGFSFFAGWIGVTVIALIMLIAGIVLLVLGLRKRPELQEFPDEVVINGVHYPKSAFVRVNTYVKGRETVFAMQELRQITGIGPEQAREIVNNWKQYYKA